MALLSKRDLKELSEERAGQCVSIYQPTHRRMPDIEQDPIRFKNLLRQAEERLIESGMRGADAREMLEPGHAWLSQREFWRHQLEGLAAFFTASSSQRYRLPLPFQELVVVAERFHLKPLMPLLSGDGQFYVLAVSGNGVRFLQGSRYSIKEVEGAELPRSLADALRFDDPEKQLQLHTTSGDMRSAGAGGSRPAVFHGQGVGTDDTKDRMLRYFRTIDRALDTILHDQQAPLVLAGVESYFAIYREANTYGNLVPGGVAGNPDLYDEQELHRHAWPVVEPIFQEKQRAEFDLHRQAAGTARYSNELAPVISAARQGRVASLFVALDAQSWGRVDPESGEIRTKDLRDTGDQDLLDYAAVQTLLHGGSVYAVQTFEVPNGADISAIFRY